METFAEYLLKSIAWLSVFTLVYLLFLRNEKFFRLKRLYLLTGILVSVIFPLITIRYRIDISVPATAGTAFSENIVAGIVTMPAAAVVKTFNYELWLFALYISGMLFLGSRILYHMITIRKTLNKAKVSNLGKARLVRISSFPASFSFFNYVFINPSVDDTEVREIVNHELVHVNQKHWLDLMLVEMLRLFQWINPFVWIYTRYVKQNNEYLADELALQRSSNPGNYKAALMNQLFNSPVFSLINSFNYSLNKKRFEMMKNRAASPHRKLKVLLILPAASLLFWAFASPEYNYVKTTEETEVVNQLPGALIGNVKGNVLKEDGTPFAEVSIVVTGSQFRSKTDMKGNFTINDVPESSFLVFSFAGYKTEVIKPAFTGAMTIKLVKDPEYKPVPTPPGMTPGSQPAVAVDSMNIDEPFVVVEQMPMFPGGDMELLKFIAENTKYPEAARAEQAEGRVIVRFVVTTEGKTEGISVLKGVHPLLDAEAARVVSMITGFTPGKQNGKAVNVWYMVPITFALNKTDTPQ